MKNILLVSATPFEIAPLLELLDLNEEIFKEKVHFEPLVTGVGMVNTTLSLCHQLTKNPYEYCINVGIAGSYRGDIPLGTAVEIMEDQYAFFGVETDSQGYESVFDLGLIQKDQFPFKDGRLTNTKRKFLSGLYQARGLTVQFVHGSSDSIERAKRQYPDVEMETMEGAAFFQTCMQFQIPCNQFRGVSNYVEPRNRNNWKIREAIDAVCDKTFQFLKAIV